MSNPYDTLNKPDPVTADKWPVMNVLELQAQRLILSDRHNKLSTMVGHGNDNPSILGLMTAVGHAINHIDQLINQKQKKQD